MNYRVLTAPKFDRLAKKLSKRNQFVRQIIANAREILRTDPYYQSKRFDIKKLTDTDEGRYRIRFGDYRIRYEIEGGDVILTKIGHRRDVYEFRYKEGEKSYESNFSLRSASGWQVYDC